LKHLEINVPKMGLTNRQTTIPMRPSAPIPNNEDSDPTSSSGSSESDSEDSEDENESIHHEPKATSANKSSVPNVSGRPKPQIHKMQGNSELLARLSAFLPQMKSANEELEKDIAAGKDVVMDDEDENKDYIEMVCLPYIPVGDLICWMVADLCRILGWEFWRKSVTTEGMPAVMKPMMRP
jgi:hypothetical protein